MNTKVHQETVREPAGIIDRAKPMRSAGGDSPLLVHAWFVSFVAVHRIAFESSTVTR